MARNERIQKTFCTTREAAQMLGVSLRTAQLWAESGLLEAWKTDGGHRRISRHSVERLLASPAANSPSNNSAQTFGSNGNSTLSGREWMKDVCSNPP